MSGPWSPELALEFGRAHVETGDFNGCYLLGREDGIVVIPCIADQGSTAAMIGLEIIAGNLPSPEWLLLIADTYHLGGVARREEAPASLEAAFLAGDSRVSEAISVLCLSPDGPSYHGMQPYHREDGVIEWGAIDTHVDMSGMGGGLVELMRAVLVAPAGSEPRAADQLGLERILLNED